VIRIWNPDFRINPDTDVFRICPEMLWSLAHACQVWSTSVSTFHSYPVYRMTDEIRRQNFNQKWSGIRIRIFGLIRIWMWCLSDLSRNVVDTVSCQFQSFRQVWCKWAVDCMRNANKINVQKSPIPQCWRKWKKWLGIHTRIRITSKS